MYLFYIDESGDTGLKKDGSPTDAFTLSALIIKDINWLKTLGDIVNFRRFLKNKFGLRMRDELKAKYLIHGNGPFTGLSIGSNVRKRIYKQALRLQVKAGSFLTWAITIDKNEWEKQGKPGDVFETCWKDMIQRIERFTNYFQDDCIIIPDQGHAHFVRAMFRKMRRHSLVTSAFDPMVTLSRPATFVIEDPNFRNSGESYFIQLADLNAYAAYRHVYPRPDFGGEYWDQLGDTRVKEVNKLRGGPTGIVLWPAPKP